MPLRLFDLWSAPLQAFRWMLYVTVGAQSNGRGLKDYWRVPGGESIGTRRRLKVVNLIQHSVE